MKIIMTKVTAILLLITILSGSLPLNIWADTADVAVVWADGSSEENGTKYTDVKKAWSDARNKGNIKMLTDWKISTALDLGNSETINLYMNGKMIDRNKANADADLSDSGGNGSVIRMSDKSELNIIGGDSTTVHKGYVSKNVWFASDSVEEDIVELTGAVITGGGSDSDYGGAITVDEKAVLTVEDVTFAGNVVDEYMGSNGNGGAIKLKSTGAKLVMKDSKICYNKAIGYGGAIISEGDEVEIQLENSIIEYNKAELGGGVFIDDTNVRIYMDTKSEIRYNEAKEGGAVYIDDEHAYILGGKMKGNKATSGGGIYVCDDFATISECKITENTASNKGGGIYLDVYGDSFNLGNDCTLMSVEITNNSAGNNGGGIFIEDAWEDIALKNQVIIKDNDAKNEYSKNMYFAGGTGTDAVITSAGGRGSEIHVGFSLDGENWALTGKGAFVDSYFYCDDSRYYIEYDLNKSKLIAKKGARDEKAITIKVSHEDFEAQLVDGLTYDVGSDKYPVYRGYYSLVESGEDTYDDTVSFYYSDGYFFNDPEKYDPHLASLVMNLVHASGSSANGGSKDYTNKFTNIRQLLCDMGCDDSKTRVNDAYMEKMTQDSIGVIISQKKLYTASGRDSGRILIPVVVRSSAYESEWAGNFNLGTEGEHKGFDIAATTVIKELDTYIEEMNLTQLESEGNISFLICGFSRGGATANLVSKRLTERYYGGAHRVYGYCIAAPQGGVQSDQLMRDAEYNNIHNIINISDLVPYVAPVEMGFKRYGVDHYVPGSAAGDVTEKEWYYSKYSGEVDTSKTKYYADNVGYAAKRKSDGTLTKENEATYGAQRTKMLKQFYAVAGAKGFSDYFHVGAIDLYTLFFGPFDETGDGDVSVDEWIQDFLHYLQVWGTRESANTRNYVVNQTLAHDMSVLDAVADIMAMMKESSDSNPLFKIIDGFMNQSILHWILTGALGIEALDDLHRILFNDFVVNVSDTSLNHLIDRLWFIIDASGTLDGFSGKDLERIEKDLDVILLFLLKFIEQDHKNSEGEYRDGLVHDYNSSADAIGLLDDWFIMTGTLINNKSFLENHATRNYLSWIRSYDSYYTDYEIKTHGGGTGYAPRYLFKPDTKTEVPIVSGIEVGGKYNQNMIVSFELPEEIKGGSIYYQISYHDEGSKESQTEELQLYTDPIEFSGKETKAVVYDVVYYTMYYGVKSDKQQISFTIEPSSLIGSIIQSGSIVSILAMASVMLIGGTAVVLYKKKKETKDKN